MEMPFAVNLIWLLKDLILHAPLKRFYVPVGAGADAAPGAAAASLFF
jgi:hypothetical protein